MLCGVYAHKPLHIYEVCVHLTARVHRIEWAGPTTEKPIQNVYIIIVITTMGPIVWRCIVPCSLLKHSYMGWTRSPVRHDTMMMRTQSTIVCTIVAQSHHIVSHILAAVGRSVVVAIKSSKHKWTKASRRDIVYWYSLEMTHTRLCDLWKNSQCAQATPHSVYWVNENIPHIIVYIMFTHSTEKYWLKLFQQYTHSHFNVHRLSWRTIPYTYTRTYTRCILYTRCPDTVLP